MNNNNVPGSNQNVNVQVRALTIDPAVTIQYKTKILHKNVVNGVNTLTQAMMNETNIKYVIKYDYVLDEDITVPANCILDFDGGSISGAHIIIGTNTKIKYYSGIIFKNNINFSGTWEIDTITTRMFDDLSFNNDLRRLINLSNDNYNNKIYIENHGYDYTFDFTEESEEGIILKSNTHLIINGNITLKANALSKYEIVYVLNKKNVIISGKGQIIGDKNSHIGDTEYGHCIMCHSSSDIVIEQITIKNAEGDGIDLRGCGNVIIQNVITNNTGRQGITISLCENVRVTGCLIDTVNCSDPQSGINIEPNPGDGNKSKMVMIENCHFKNINKYAITGVGFNDAESQLIVIANCYLENTFGIGFVNTDNIYIYNIKSNGGILYFSNCKNIVISNLYNTGESSISVNTSNIKIEDCYIKSASIAICELLNSEVYIKDSVIDNYLLKNYSGATKLVLKDSKFKGNISLNFAEGSIIYNNILQIVSATGENQGIKVGDSQTGGLVIFENNQISLISAISYIFTIQNFANIRHNRISIKYAVNNNIARILSKNVAWEDNIIEFAQDVTPKAILFGSDEIRARAVSNLSTSGTTEERPTLYAQSLVNYNEHIGDCYFDTTLGKPIYWNGTVWVDATGATV